MKPDWRKCKMLSAGDKRAVKVIDDQLRMANKYESWMRAGFTTEAMMHMTGLLKKLAAKVAELEKKK